MGFEFAGELSGKEANFIEIFNCEMAVQKQNW